MPIQAVLLAIIFPLIAYFGYRYGREREKDPEYQRNKREKAIRKRRAAKPGGWLYYARRNGFAPKK